MLTILAAVAAWEREIMLERQREGIAKAKADGRYKGRAPTARRQADTVRELRNQGMSPTAIAAQGWRSVIDSARLGAPCDVDRDQVSSPARP